MCSKGILLSKWTLKFVGFIISLVCAVLYGRFVNKRNYHNLIFSPKDKMTIG